MTATAETRPDGTPGAQQQPLEDVDQTPAKHHPYRWRLHRAGLIDTWFYYDTEFDLAGGRLVLRGTNGSGKSRALELLLPFLLDADRRKMDATGSQKVSLVELMKAGAEDRTTRVGYIWVELARTVDPDDLADADLHAAGATEAYFTIGAQVRYSASTNDAKVHFFTTDLRVGTDLELLSPMRDALPREKLADLIGADRITSSPAVHRDRVRAAVFTLTGDSGDERYSGLLQLLHTLRSPDVGNRIEEGRLPQILSDALPPLNEGALNDAGAQLDSLSETRNQQQRLENSLEHVTKFLGTYRRYAAAVIAEVADTADRASSTAAAAERRAVEKRTQHEKLEHEHAVAQSQVAELTTTKDELEAEISGIRASSEYAGARDLREREETVSALAAKADNAIEDAERTRRAEGRTADAADQAASAAVEAGQAVAQALDEARTRLQAAHVTGTLPAAVTVTAPPAPAVTDSVRRQREADPVPTTRRTPQQVAVTPAPPADIIEQLGHVTTSASERSRQIDNRLARARELDKMHRKVEDAARTAAAAREQADEAAAELSGIRADLDTEATAYVGQWATWLSSPDIETAFETAPTLDPPESGTELTAALAGVLAGPGRLALDLDDALTDDELAAFDNVATVLARPVHERHNRRIADLDAGDCDDIETRKGLEAERDDLNAQRDPAPTAPTWVQPNADGVPLWRAVDFAPDLDPALHAGLEGALLASGLLSATVHPDASLRAADGQLILTPAGASQEQPLLGVLVPDAASGMPHDVVEHVLARIGYGVPDADHAGGDRTGLLVDGHGSWAAGPLQGRHAPATARHIGATARAAARAARLNEIVVELEAVANRIAARAEERTQARAAISRLDAATAHAPRTRLVITARARVRDADVRADRAAGKATREELAADRVRTEWVRASQEHRSVCTEFGLPYEADALDTAREAARQAIESCRRLHERLRDLGRTLKAHDHALDRVEAAAGERSAVEERADLEWAHWHREAAEFEAVRESVGRDADESMRRLDESTKEHRRIEGELIGVNKHALDLNGQVAAAGVEARHAAEQVEVAHTALQDAAADLQTKLALPGLADSALTGPIDPLTFPQFTPAAVRAAAVRVKAALRAHGEVDENALHRAHQTLDRELSGAFDVIYEAVDGVGIIELSDATGHRTVAAAAVELNRIVTEGRDALSERERRVFTDFVLGGVAEELRTRLHRAEELIDAMNASLATIRTSHNIGVKLRWRLADTADPAIARIRELVTTANAVRSAEQTLELTELLKARVDEAFMLDSSAGYATHLREALDYRSWHVVEVIILGPAPGQERRISRKARLSQGETRFVSYVTLFAAVDAYLSGLPDTGRALRLLLLDDAFAKVDDPTIGELMGLLVRLDVDFAMTGHALWGAYPQVPKLDCYEVRRLEGMAAVTTHTHWDGHNRHLKAAR
jgi:uncharacterized protein (TIGR02680 family)